MTNFIIAFIILAILLPVYFKIAAHFNIVDKPNERSSHSKLTIRGGGIVFPAAAFLWFVMYGFNQPFIILALGLMSVVSFLDDILTLSSKIRILIHFVSVSILFWQLHIFGLPWYGIFAIYLIVIGWINAFNFMDGINGITAFYGLVSLGTIAWLNKTLEFAPQNLIILLIFSVLIFSFFNARKKAKTFAGDVGSVSMAFLLAWFIISLIMKTGRLEYILLVSVYGVDSAVTIIIRLLQRENIFQAHRTHLYQYLSNEVRLPHVFVSAIYATAQAGINILTLILISGNKMNLQLCLVFILVLTIVYLTIRLVTIRNLRPDMG
ncbi:UDP-N-acetylmuramyl pentapeptide phosphotransferase/UDP-N-acetylglucosamine-1-phosphate transferase [Mariniphaga anaerophila]|uniref:UDP-N-acetylmuramyl pentapeptide phosphotransferase/UDP-N-acetylglucosamine-1-phosphate transferase n=1 Tax=Mariniphaga anaerophila TaxID=1484053 RepID=A0A1M5BMG3_9BACT|nr:glycosyltransferase family 4 protein [Mariniphaga anaerophila]SHF43803.1 UDP-N-acetylmuramyl pentapeptide phosphotransferase/UDP-N-acetylglucosamine-1-phosphate transferase [Mariniphaga anaerophila]